VLGSSDEIRRSWGKGECGEGACEDCCAPHVSAWNRSQYSTTDSLSNPRCHLIVATHPIKQT